ncbi:Protein of unknown function [Desulfotomaculum arcticum]|uniref:DUF3231 family protein n=1 Tax=Desulfotruncus arcticus DSM 17038 TaxID=1121424 RepID=A0A1I2NVT0_9FIRM|nr:DUF3231 family protein [Desulfotruncus arcticus]SFG07643.1 Protein of unknown function [Desulfotomaculum arcticum] [Desulfotruncus arcticus DSM 17038]
MKILEQIEKISDIGKAQNTLQREINVVEVKHLWAQLVSRYQIIETTDLFNNFVVSPDLSLILNQGLKVLKSEVAELEKIMMTYGIPLPKRPPAGSDSSYKVEEINDEYIYTRILGGISVFIPIASSAFVESTSPKLRELFKTYLMKEIDLYDKFFSYGQLKGWILEPPAYRI